MVAVKNVDLKKKYFPSFYLCESQGSLLWCVWAALRPLAVLLVLRLLQHFAAKANVWVVLWCVNPSKDHVLICVLFLRLNLTGLTRSATGNTSVSTTRRRKQGR